MKKVMLFGMGEMGSALKQILEENPDFYLMGRDIRPELCFGEEVPGTLDFLHINIPWSEKFVDMVVGLIWDKHPRITIINSTIPIGTTRQIIERVGYKVVHAPVRGMHRATPDFKEYMLRFTRHIGFIGSEAGEKACSHLIEAGFRVVRAGPPEVTELMKLMNLSYYAMLITWSKQVDDICKRYNLDYHQVMDFAKELRRIYGGEIGLRPVLDPLPGPIGGHCVVPGCEHLLRTESSSLVEAVLDDNRKRTPADKVKRK